MPKDKNKKIEPEILGPEAPPEGASSGEQIPTNILLAQVSNYTNRPDLFLEAIEKADPGFIKRMNQDAEEFGKEARTSMFKFGKRQAYVGLGVSIIAALIILCTIGYAVVFKNISFWQILGLGVVFAITQGGTAGFTSISEKVSEIVGKKKSDDSPEV